MHVARFRLAAVVAGVLAAGPAFAFSVKVTPQLAAYDDAPALQGGVPATVTVASANWFDDAAMTVAGTDCAVDGTVGCTKYGSGALTLTATNGANTTFVGWAGCNSVAGNVCTLDATSDRSVTAQFKPAAYTFRVATSPRPFGTWTPSYGGKVTIAAVDYRSTAAVAYVPVLFPAGVPVVVTATPDMGSEVKAWTGCTPATPTAGTCTVTPYAPTALTVAFTAPPAALVRAGVAGDGAITGTGINCRAYTGDCDALAPVTLTAVPDAGAAFKGWTGCTSNPTPTTCSTTASAYVTATFKSASTCNSCHTAAHGGKPMDCGTCHTGYGTIPLPVTHLDGTPQGVPAKVSALPDDGVNLAITSVTATSTQVTSVTFTVTDKAGNALSALSGSALPAVVLGKLNADGTYKAYYYVTSTGKNFTVDGVTRTPALGSAGQDTQAPANSSSVAAASVVTNFTNNGSGSYTYTFPACGTDSTNGCYTSTSATARTLFGSGAVATGDETKLHTVALWITRNVATPAPATTYAFRDYDSRDFRPDAGAVTARAVVSDAACNACHGELNLHGSRRGVKSCLPCHNPSTVDPESGNNVDLASMVHKIHNGHLLANTYEIVGYNQSYFLYNHVTMAPSHAGYLEGAGIYSSAHDPGLSRECGICHGTSLTNEAYTKPTRRACGACHDDVDFAVGHYDNGSGGFIVGPQTSDGNCSGCHAPTAVEKVHSKFYASGVTTTGTKYGVDFRTDVTPGVPAGGHKFQAQIVSVENSGTQLKWTLDFKIDNGAGVVPYNIKSAVTSANGVDDSYVLAACTFQLSGPNADYVLPATGSATGGGCATPANWTAVLDASLNPIPGRFSYLAANYFTATPAKAAGNYTASFEMMLSRQWSPSAAADRIRKPFAADPNFITLSVDAAGVVTQVTEQAALLAAARRTVVEYGKCNTCHEDLGFHSNRNRQGPDYCATCHNPMLDNGTRARFTVAEAYTVPGTTQLGYLPESVSMNVFIHRIHMGKRLPSVGGLELSGTGNSGAALRSKWVADQVGEGSIVYGATRSAFVGVTATTPPEFADLSEYAQPNYVNRCEQCHIDVASQQTWALPELPGLAPVKRDYRTCVPATANVSWATEPWCDNTSTSGPAKVGSPVYTPALKASCTSCHDSAATDAHADLFTLNPMTQGATELCASCHGAGKSFDSLLVHRRVP
jgi:OmcA/MtrC family decaheme c-type cytochrome